MRTRTRAVVFGTIVALAVACGTSDVPDDADVTITGTLLRPDGTPASGITVGLMEEPDGLDALVELAATVTTVGMLCLAQQVAICEGTRRAKTGDDGGFTFTLKGKDTKTILGNPARFMLSARLDSGAQTHVRFDASETSIDVPQLSFWQPEGLKVDAGPQWVRYSWPPLRTKPLPSGYRLEVTEDDEVVWVQATQPSGRLDSRAVADTQGRFRAVAMVDDGPFAIEHHSPPVPLHGVVDAPRSRGAACTIEGRDSPVALEPCVFTDGRYSGAFPSQSCGRATPSPTPSTCLANTRVTIDLGTSRPVGTIILHGLGLSSDVLIYTSEDGTTWSERARHRPSRYAVLGITPPVRARYVRVRSSEDTSAIRSLQEVSIWP